MELVKEAIHPKQRQGTNGQGALQKAYFIARVLPRRTVTEAGGKV